MKPLIHFKPIFTWIRNGWRKKRGEWLAPAGPTSATNQILRWDFVDSALSLCLSVHCTQDGDSQRCDADAAQRATCFDIVLFRSALGIKTQGKGDYRNPLGPALPPSIAEQRREERRERKEKKRKKEEKKKRRKEEDDRKKELKRAIAIDTSDSDSDAEKRRERKRKKLEKIIRERKKLKKKLKDRE